MRLNQHATIDCEVQKQIDLEIKKWKGILQRILDGILFLAKQNLPLRGHNEHLNQTEGPSNTGNFLELMKFLGKYDPVMSEHFAACKLQEGSVSYLSPTIQNELIEHLGSKVRCDILEDVRHSKYFSLMLDTTPDLSHDDQLSQIVRYVSIKGSKVEVIESFIDFVKVDGKKSAENMTGILLRKLKEDSLDIANCRGQGYDNAATMAGVHSGVQQRILSINPKAIFIPCSNHSLNLVGQHAAAVTVGSTTFFGALDQVFNFFSSSTYRWEVLKKYVPVTLKRSAFTRWSASKEAVAVFSKHFHDILIALEAMTSSEENLVTRGDAGLLRTNILTFSFIAYLFLWSRILPEINDVQIYLQRSGLTLEMCATKLKSLKLFMKEERDSLVKNAIEQSTAICEELGISTEQRVRGKRRMPGEKTVDSRLTLKANIQREQYQVSLHS